MRASQVLLTFDIDIAALLVGGSMGFIADAIWSKKRRENRRIEERFRLLERRIAELERRTDRALGAGRRASGF